MTTRTGEPEDPRVGADHGKGCWCATCEPAPRSCRACGGPLEDEDDCDCEEEQPEPDEPLFCTCHYCGTTYEGTGDDCGGCRLTGEDLDAYARDRCAAAPTWIERRFTVVR